ncbi:MAG: hypothetical protein ACYC9O_18965 [Candidatus Latescibacterota bacterium]
MRVIWYDRDIERSARFYVPCLIVDVYGKLEKKGRAVKRNMKVIFNIVFNKENYIGIFIVYTHFSADFFTFHNAHTIPGAGVLELRRVMGGELLEIKRLTIHLGVFTYWSNNFEHIFTASEHAHAISASYLLPVLPPSGSGREGRDQADVVDPLKILKGRHGGAALLHAGAQLDYSPGFYFF